MKKWWLLYLQLPWDKRVLWSSGCLALIPVTLTLLQPSVPEARPVHDAMELDTHIPKGFVLVPIDVQNYEALDSILGRFGLVDLYQGESRDGGKQQLVARNVRLLRAPQNPSHFAVLIPEGDAPSVLRYSGLFTVIVKRPAAAGTEFVKDQAHPRRSISYDGG